MRRSTPSARRGIAAVVMVLLLLIVDVIVLGVVLGGAREHDLTARRLETVQAFYAAEGGMNMAIRELMENTDEDGDGGIGSVSDDGDDGNNPELGSATVYVTLATDAGQTTLTSQGESGEARREIEADLLAYRDRPARPDDPWWDLLWLERAQLILDNSAQSTNLVDFPVLAVLDSSRIDYAKTQDSGEDIRFTDSDGTPLDYEIEQWDENGSCYVWVSVPQIDASSDTDYIWMYYSNAGATDDQDPANVWGSDYQLVWHCQEAAGATIADSTAKGNDGTKKAATEPSPVASGKIGGAQEYDGSDDGVMVNGLQPLAIAITMEAWIRPVSFTPDWATIAQFKDDKPFFGLCESTTEAGKPVLNIWRKDKELKGSAAVPFGEWSYVATTHAGTTACMYLNGVLDRSGSVPRGDKGEDFYVGIWEAWKDSPFDGIIDEVRVSTVLRSADWIAAQYLSMTDAFINWRPSIVRWREVEPGS
jgi:hypothetical protein